MASKADTSMGLNQSQINPDLNRSSNKMSAFESKMAKFSNRKSNVGGIGGGKRMSTLVTQGG